MPKVIKASNGDMVVLAPGDPGISDQVQHGQLAKDGSVVIPSNDPAIAARVKLAFAGVISIAVAFTARGEVAGDPDVLMSGLPSHTRDGKPMDVTVDDAIFNTLDNLGRGKRRDPEAAANAIERSVRGAVGAAWGKKPLVHVLILEA